MKRMFTTYQAVTTPLIAVVLSTVAWLLNWVAIAWIMSTLFFSFCLYDLILHRIPCTLWPRLLLAVLLAAALSLMGDGLANQWLATTPWSLTTSTTITTLYLVGTHILPWWQQQQRQLQQQLLALQSAQQKAERELVAAQLCTLQAQVEPHFLFNTLAQLLYMIRDHSDDSEIMLQHLIAYLRAALPDLRATRSTVERELQLARSYLCIMQFRMGSRLQYEVSGEPQLANLNVPPLMLISLVENAIRHGIEPKPGVGSIRVTATLADQFLKIEVTDTGIGLSAQSTGGGVGLSNIQQRLRSLYGERAKLQLITNAEGGVCASLFFPVNTDDE